MSFKKRLNVNVDAQKYLELKLKATSQDVTLSELVISWVNDYLVSDSSRKAEAAESR